MTPQTFRRLALSFPGAIEGEHMGHPDFRAGPPRASGGKKGRIFASLSGGEDGEASGMVKVSPEDQEELVAAHPEVFRACAGAWGRQGCTAVDLKHARAALLRPAMRRAWELAAGEGRR